MRMLTDLVWSTGPHTRVRRRRFGLLYMPTSSGVLVSSVTACTIFISSAMRPYTDLCRFSSVRPSKDLLTMVIMNLDSSPPDSSTMESFKGSSFCSLHAARAAGWYMHAVLVFWHETHQVHIYGTVAMHDGMASANYTSKRIHRGPVCARRRCARKVGYGGEDGLDLQGRDVIIYEWISFATTPA